MNKIGDKLKAIDNQWARLLKAESIQAKAHRFEWSIEGVRYASLATSVGVLCAVVMQRENLQIDASLVLYFSAMVLGILGYDTGRKSHIWDTKEED